VAQERVEVAQEKSSRMKAPQLEPVAGEPDQTAMVLVRAAQDYLRQKEVSPKERAQAEMTAEATSQNSLLQE
jgi:hypothetical protein